MESKSYKELQALAKLHGIRANLSKAALIEKLASQDEGHEHPPQDSSQDSSQGNAEEPQADSDTPQGNNDDEDDDEPVDDVDTPKNDSGSNTPERNVVDDSGSNSADKSDVLSGTAVAEAAHDRVDVDTDVPAPLDPVESEVLLESSERRKSDRLSAAKKEKVTTEALTHNTYGHALRLIPLFQ